MDIRTVHNCFKFMAIYPMGCELGVAPYSYALPRWWLGWTDVCFAHRLFEVVHMAQRLLPGCNGGMMVERDITGYQQLGKGISCKSQMLVDE